MDLSVGRGGGDVNNNNNAVVDLSLPRKEEKEVMMEKEVMVIRSNGLTQTDRDYFNIVKTEDGVSNFFRANEQSRKQLKSRNFLFHSVRREEDGEKVAALYLPDVT